MTYQEVKNELNALVSSTRYFTRQWYKLYLSCLEKTRENEKNGVDDSFQLSDGVTGYKSWKAIYDSKFYKYNSCAYCEFLSVVYGRV